MRNAAGKPPTAKSNLSKMAVSGDRAARRDPHRDRRVRPNRDRVCRNRPDLPNRRDRHSDDHPAEAADDGPNDGSPSKAWWRPKPWRPRKRRKGVSISASASPSENRSEECAPPPKASRRAPSFSASSQKNGKETTRNLQGIVAECAVGNILGANRRAGRKKNPGRFRPGNKETPKALGKAIQSSLPLLPPPTPQRASRSVRFLLRRIFSYLRMIISAICLHLYPVTSGSSTRRSLSPAFRPRPGANPDRKNSRPLPIGRKGDPGSARQSHPIFLAVVPLADPSASFAEPALPVEKYLPIFENDYQQRFVKICFRRIPCLREPPCSCDRLSFRAG